MRAALRERTRERMNCITALVLVISIGFLVPKAAAQSDKYLKMAPVDQSARFRCRHLSVILIPRTWML